MGVVISSHINCHQVMISCSLYNLRLVFTLTVSFSSPLNVCHTFTHLNVCQTYRQLADYTFNDLVAESRILPLGAGGSWGTGSWACLGSFDFFWSASLASSSYPQYKKSSHI